MGSADSSAVAGLRPLTPTEPPPDREVMAAIYLSRGAIYWPPRPY